ncbi:molybdenum cofactor guanylyltransferase [Thalassomonas sp. M1454]|uniref:molybdenum cofactor guanylyltransferase n=1 Tax=Thalassomonas sp. M1454 TaxID=2594477 RepID=UPI00117D6B4B|nr:molybdenum cofactor guanylyltransferase [Thalassomonas sp. M1454]TRX53816.1 molybdenum cofactor guanylyltransferase [Thalassomonas sp. M1454]
MSCIGVVLAGGLSSRMGTDKAKLQLGEQSMLSFSQDLLRRAGVDKVICSGENVGGIKDLYQQGGPLAGIYSVIKSERPQAILAIPVDMPFLTSKQLTELKLKGELSQRATYFNDSSLPVYLPVNALVSQYLEQEFSSSKFLTTGKGPSFKQVFKRCNALSLPLKDQQQLINTNTPEQFKQAQQILTKTRSNYV